MLREPVHRTILALDIEGSTRPERRDRDRLEMRAVLRRLLGQALDHAGIQRGDYQRTDQGDGILVLLNPDVPKTRVLPWLILRLAAGLDRHNRTAPAPLRLRLRVAMHAGEVVSDAHGYTSRDLNLAFRLLDSDLLRSHLAGTPTSLVLVISDSIYHDIVQPGYGGIEADAFQQVHVATKGTRAAAWIYLPGRQEVSTDERQAGYWQSPTLPLAPPDPHDLPADISAFTGRKAELERLQTVIGQAERRSPTVIAINGMGGVGKSALAVHAAHRLISHFPDGQLYVNLQGATAGLGPLDTGEVLSRLLRGLGVDSRDIPISVEAAAARFRSLVADRRVLLVLDDAVSAGQVRSLLPESSSCATLITSRRPLASLAVTGHFRLDVLLPEEAIRLLGRLAGTQRLAAEPEAAEELARQCGYLPLALRIAGARLAARPGWTVRALVERLADERTRLDELSVADVDVRSGFQVGYTDLSSSGDDRERTAARLFRLLGLHHGPDIGVWGAAALLGVEPASAEMALDRLVDARLLESVDGRYRLESLLLLFAREKASDEREQERSAALRRLHEFYLATATRASRLLQATTLEGGRSTLEEHGQPLATRSEALVWFEAERANLTATLQQAIDADMTAGIPDLADRLFAYYKLRRHWDDAALTYEIALRAARQRGNRLIEAKILNNLGAVCLEQRRFEDSLWFLEHSLAMHRDIQDRWGERLALANLGVAYRKRRQPADAIACLQQSLAIARAIGDRAGEGQTLASLGAVYADLGRWAEAAEQYRMAVVVAREVGDRDTEGDALMNLGVASHGLGHFDEAIAYFEQSLVVHDGSGHEHEMAVAHATLGAAYLGEGRPDSAAAHYEQSLRIARGLGDEQAQVRALFGLGDVRAGLGEFTSAVQYLTQAMELVPDIGDPPAEASACATLASAYEQLGELGQAVSCYERALQLSRGVGDRVREASLLTSLADVLAQLGRREQSISSYEYGLGILRDLGDQRGEAWALKRLAELYKVSGRVDEADACARRSRALRAAVPQPRSGGDGSRLETNR